MGFVALEENISNVHFEHKNKFFIDISIFFLLW